jgi:hypothetical protein
MAAENLLLLRWILRNRSKISVATVNYFYWFESIRFITFPVISLVETKILCKFMQFYNFVKKEVAAAAPPWISLICNNLTAE